MQTTLKREVYEETGLEVTDMEILEVKDGMKPEDFQSDTHFIFINFLCRSVTSSDVQLDNREATDYIWIEPERALEELEINESTRGLIRTFIREYSCD